MDDYVSADFIAAKLRVDPQTVRRWARQGWRSGPDGQPLPGVVDFERMQAGAYRFRLAPELARTDVVAVTLTEARRRTGLRGQAFQRAVAAGELHDHVVAVYQFPRLVRVLMIGHGTVQLPPRRVDPIDWKSQPLGRVSDRRLAAMLGTTPGRVSRARQRLGLPPCGRPGRMRTRG